MPATPSPLLLTGKLIACEFVDDLFCLSREQGDGTAPRLRGLQQVRERNPYESQVSRYRDKSEVNLAVDSERELPMF